MHMYNMHAYMYICIQLGKIYLRISVVLMKVGQYTAVQAMTVCIVVEKRR